MTSTLSHVLVHLCFFFFLCRLLLILGRHRTSHEGGEGFTSSKPPLDSPLYVIHRHGGPYWENCAQSLEHRLRLKASAVLNRDRPRPYPNPKMFFIDSSIRVGETNKKTGKVNLLHSQSQFPSLHPPSWGK